MADLTDPDARWQQTLARRWLFGTLLLVSVLAAGFYLSREPELPDYNIRIGDEVDQTRAYLLFGPGGLRLSVTNATDVEWQDAVAVVRHRTGAVYRKPLGTIRAKGFAIAPMAELEGSSDSVADQLSVSVEIVQAGARQSLRMPLSVVIAD